MAKRPPLESKEWEAIRKHNCGHMAGLQARALELALKLEPQELISFTMEIQKLMQRQSDQEKTARMLFTGEDFADMAIPSQLKERAAHICNAATLIESAATATDLQKPVPAWEREAFQSIFNELKKDKSLNPMVASLLRGARILALAEKKMDLRDVQENQMSRD